MEKQMTPFESKMYEVCKKLGAKSDLLSIIGSYKDTMSDEDVLSDLSLWLAPSKRVYWILRGEQKLCSVATDDIESQLREVAEEKGIPFSELRYRIDSERESPLS